MSRRSLDSALALRILTRYYREALERLLGYPSPPPWIKYYLVGGLDLIAEY